MEAAIRWSPHATPESPDFLIVDVVGNRLKLCQVESLQSKSVKYKQISQRDHLPNYTAFDWSKTDPYFVAIGAASGEANLVRIDPERSQNEENIWSFPIRHQRKCNSIAFSAKNYLATGLDKVRTDWCMNIYDLSVIGAQGSRQQQDPIRKLATSEPISSIKFFNSQPDTLVCGVRSACIRIFDLRDHATTSAAYFNTRQVHNLAIDPKDENYFISAGPPGDPVVTVWDCRMASKSSSSTPSSETGPAGPVLEIKSAVDNSQSAAIWSLRFCGVKRGCFGVLSSTGEIKVFELGQHAVKSTLVVPPSNHLGGTPWTSKHYTRRTHNLAYPWYDKDNGQEEDSRIIAYDFLPEGKGLAALALHPNREVELLNVPDHPRNLNFTARDELYVWKDRRKRFAPHRKFPSVAEDLKALQKRAKASDGVRRDSEQALLQTTSRVENLSIENFGHKAPATPHHTSSGDQHEDLLKLWFPSYKPAIGDALNILGTQRRRCFEGYLLNAQENKAIVANDPWLVDMWDTVKRFEDMAKNDGMLVDAFDFSYLGVFAIWNNTFGAHRNRIFRDSTLTNNKFVNAVVNITRSKEYPVFQGSKTMFPAHRQLCLAICGWTFSKDRLRQYCRRLMGNGEHYKAVVIAVMRGFKDLAQELLRSAIQQKTLQNIGLGAVIACETVNAEQRELCSWMADETDDPYLKALLNYFIKGDWKIVADMQQLALSDRVGVALKYLDDTRLDEFIKIQTAEAVLIGNIEGLVLTGLTDRAMDLLSNYIKKFNDLQTAVLVASFTNPLYLDDPRFTLWKNTYEMQMQTWRAFRERMLFNHEHRKKSISHDKRQFGTIPTRPLTLRCNHCLNPLAPRTMKPQPDGSILTITAPRLKFSNSPAAKAGQLCPHCGNATPVCGICGLGLAAPDVRKLHSASARKLAEEDGLSHQAVHCMTCNHAFHGNHARDWFARHKMCPVPDCRCMCGLLH
ncbi:hypothetical protein EJ08DRAFT_669597 [Tothia fuscella]|uniref:Uncharacterized protein n=1 Tax=Tothia fuscella TaxID=1048955 RepID=A0A9P4TZT5_9PEZI|nr:hypothetical protein EJ08DRAFT_669597 [Tothia fuscella]